MAPRRISKPKSGWAIVAVLGLLVTGGGIALALSPTDAPEDRDDRADRWLLLGATKAPDGRPVILVRAAQELADCESSSATASQAGGGYRITVRRVREGCDGPQPATAKLPPTLEVRLPAAAFLTGQTITGPGYEGVGVSTAPSRSVPYLVGLKPGVATQIVKAAGLELRRRSVKGYVRRQSPSGGTPVVAGKEPTVRLR